MSRFADPTAVDRMVLGSCQCPGKPHEEDWIEMRVELGAQDVLNLLEGDSLRVLKLLIRDWNILDKHGNKPEVNDESIALLYSDTYDELDAWIEGHVRMRASLPNASAAPSRSSTRRSGSSTRRATKVS
jgi:hypothetical protein